MLYLFSSWRDHGNELRVGGHAFWTNRPKWNSSILKLSTHSLHQQPPAWWAVALASMLCSLGSWRLWPEHWSSYGAESEPASQSIQLLSKLEHSGQEKSTKPVLPTVLHFPLDASGTTGEGSSPRFILLPTGVLSLMGMVAYMRSVFSGFGEPHLHHFGHFFNGLSRKIGMGKNKLKVVLWCVSWKSDGDWVRNQNGQQVS